MGGWQLRGGLAIMLWGCAIGCTGDRPPSAAVAPAGPPAPPAVPAAEAEAEAEAEAKVMFRCNRCGQDHPGPLLSFRIDAPVSYDQIPAADRDRRAALSEDQCIIDDRDHFIAGNIEIPIRDSPDHLTFTVWVSLSPRNFERASELWEQPGRESEPPYFGWLSSRLPGYPDTVNLKTMVQTRPVGIRPSIELEPTDHPLAVAQRRGITREQVAAISELAAHPGP